MGAETSKPQPGAQLRVIGAGMMRTGTASFSEALRILLDGPVYHCGTQQTRPSDGSDTDAWLSILPRFPVRNDADKQFVGKVLRKRMDGFVAVTDGPANLFVPELLDLYPDAVVICTTRDPAAWAKSLQPVADAVGLWGLHAILFPIKHMRRFVPYIQAGRQAYCPLFGSDITPEAYERHLAWLRSNVPPEKLFFFDVRDGWEPLCKILGKEVPSGVPFPRINDGLATERIARELIVTGLVRWAGILGVFALPVLFALRR